eukprot:4558645-Alexandrium_andersonii.AAC.1
MLPGLNTTRTEGALGSLLIIELAELISTPEAEDGGSAQESELLMLSILEASPNNPPVNLPPSMHARAQRLGSSKRSSTEHVKSKGRQLLIRMSVQTQGPLSLGVQVPLKVNLAPKAAQRAEEQRNRSSGLSLLAGAHGGINLLRILGPRPRMPFTNIGTWTQPCERRAAP